MTLEPPNSISVPAIKELPLILECRVIYKQKQDEREIREGDKLKRKWEAFINFLSI